MDDAYSEQDDELIYLDHPATTPCDGAVIEAMLPWMTSCVGNAGQRGHVRGRAAAAAVAQAREQLAAAAGFDPRRADVLFTGGATEANNLAVLGVGAALPHGAHVVTTAVEHASVLAPVRLLAARGVRVTIVGVDADGVVDHEAFDEAMRQSPALVSIQSVNNETGVQQALDVLCPRAQAAGALVHVDAVQALGKVMIDPAAWGIDLMSVSAHKVYGPAGVGALIAADQEVRARVQPLLHGGGQECGVRPGTVNVAGVVGFGEAAQLAAALRESESSRCMGLRDRLEHSLLREIDGTSINGAGAVRGPVITSVLIDGIDTSELLATLPQIAAGTTSACSAGAPSHVLRAMGRSRSQASSVIRLGIGRSTSPAALDRAVELLAGATMRRRVERGCAVVSWS